MSDAAAPFPRGGPTTLRVILGVELRRLREAQRISAEDAGYAIRGSQSKISRMEAGRVGFKQRDVADLLTLYGVEDEGERERLLAMAQGANTPDWWQRYGDILPSWFWTYLGLEEAASHIRAYEVQCVPELLQTEAYARALLRLVHPGASDQEIASRVDLRLRRQRVLDRPDGPHLWALVDEAALRRTVGGPEVMRAQMEFLGTARDNVAVQVVPFDAEFGAAVGSPFTILRFAAPMLSDVVYLEQPASALYLDRAGDVGIYTRLWDRLSVEAAPPAATAARLKDLYG